jgi:hypothetical protein
VLLEANKESRKSRPPMIARTREIDSEIFYFTRPGEDTSNLIAAVCSGNCLEPDICDGDYLVFNTKSKPEIGDFVCYKGIGYQLQVSEDGHTILRNGHEAISAPVDNNYDGVVIQINRKL